MTYKKERFESRILISDLIQNYYDFEQTFAKCKDCPGFAGTWSCPSFDFDPLDYWKDFHVFHFIVDKVSNQGCYSAEEAQNRLFAEKNLYDREMLTLEGKIPGSRALAAQECVCCKKCARLLGKPCVHPELMRYALESLGILAVKLVKDQFGFDVLWSDGESIPEYYLLVGGVLEK